MKTSQQIKPESPVTMRIRHYFASLAPPASDLPVGEEEEAPRKKEVNDHHGGDDDDHTNGAQGKREPGDS